MTTFNRKQAIFLFLDDKLTKANIDYTFKNRISKSEIEFKTKGKIAISTAIFLNTSRHFCDIEYDIRNRKSFVFFTVKFETSSRNTQ